MADINLTFGVLGGSSVNAGSGKLIKDALDGIMRSINSEPLKVKVKVDESSLKQMQSQINSMLDKSVASNKASVKVGSKSVDITVLTKGTEAYGNALKALQHDLTNLTVAEKNWTQSQNSNPQQYQQIVQLRQAYESLRTELKAGQLTQDEFTSRLQILGGEAADAIGQIRRAGEATQALEPGTKRYGNLLRQIETQIEKNTANLNKWSSAENSSNSTSREAYQSLQNQNDELQILANNLSSYTFDDATAKFRNIQGASAAAGAAIRKAGDDTRSFKDQFEAMSKRLSSWFSMGSLIMAGTRAIREMVSASMELNDAFAQLKIVTGANDAEMAKFADTAGTLAKKLGQSVSDVAGSIETFSRLGYNLNEASQLTEWATVLSNVGAVSVEEATTGMTSIIKGFGDTLGVEDAEHVADVLVEVGQKYAVSASELMQAFERSGAALNATNTSFEKSAGLIAAANAAVQDASTVGTALKTISARIRGSKSDLDELGESTDDLAQGFSKYAGEIQALTGFNIMVEGSTTEFKDLYDIMEGIAGIWDNLSGTQQARVAEILGGTRQLQVITSILGNWGDAAGAYADALDSANVATSANEIYMSTATAHLNQFKAAFQELSSSIADSSFIAQIIDIGRWLLEFANSLVKLLDKIGGVKTLLPIILAYLTSIKKINIAGGLSAGLQDFIFKLSESSGILKTFILDFSSAKMSGLSTTKSLSAGFSGVAASISTAQLALGAFGVLLAAASMGISAYEKKRQQSISDDSNAAEESARLVENAKSLEEVYSEYNKLYNISEQTSETQNRMSEALSGVTDKLGDQAYALSGLAQGTKEYDDKLKALIKTEREKAMQEAEREKASSINALQGMAWSKITGDKTRVRLKSDTAKDVMSDYAETIFGTYSAKEDLYLKGSNGRAHYEGISANNVVSYYNQLVEARNKLLDAQKRNGELNEKESSDLSTLNSKIGELKDGVDAYTQSVYDVASMAYMSENGTPTNAVELEAYRSAMISTLSESMDISEDDARDIVEDFIDAESYAQEIESAMNAAAKKAREVSGSFKGTLDNFDIDTSGLETLGNIYDDVADGGNFDWSSILNNDDFANTFGNLGDYYNDFVETITNNSGNIEACQKSFDDLTSAYIRSTGALNDLTIKNKDAAIAMLEQKGVANATAIVEHELAVQEEYAALQKKYSADMSYVALQALLDEAQGNDIATDAVIRLIQAKLQAALTTVTTSGDIENCIALANAAGVATASLLNMQAAKAAMGRSEAYAERAKNATGRQKDTLTRLSAATESQARELLNKPVEFDPIKYTGGGGSAINFVGGGGARSSGGGGSSSSSSEEKVETWFEKQYAEHQHLVNLEKEDQATYLAWLEKAYKQAYNEGIIELDEYRKYAEEVFSGLRELFDDYISDIDHEIKMRSNYDGEKQKIISLYKEEIKAIEGEIAKARQYGLDDNDDYIQELQDKWQSAKDNLQEIYDDALDGAKDAVDDLVDYVEDMLKQDVEDQKDALDKKLDYLKEFYDKQKELLQDAYDEEEYLKDQAEKRKSVTDIQAALEQLAYDDSAWAQKRKLELQDELDKAQEELNQFEKDHALEEALDALEDAYNEQEKQLQAQMDALSEVINDPEALYNKALSYIKDNTDKLYEEMLEYNRRNGTGNDEDIKDKYEEAYKALLEYNEVNGSWYKGIKLENSTNVKPSNGNWNSQTVANPTPATNPNTSAPKTSNPNVSTPSSSPTTKTADEATAKGVAAAIWCEGTQSGWGNGDDRKNKLTAKFGSEGQQKIQGLLNSASDGSLYNYWVSSLGKNASKYYYSKFYTGTSNAPYGFAKINELGDELIFSPRAGGQFKLLSGGEKIFNADATSFLYDFANGGGDILANIIGMAISKFSPALAGASSTPVINMGDIIVNGNADMQTVSEIRRAQRANVEYMLREFNKLNK
ncbi:MAG: phage tail tape measure protein [Oscillospiraceae bacterium]|nr:phage tail tape measure protein [Candidatus Limimonas egerieequi]